MYNQKSNFFIVCLLILSSNILISCSPEAVNVEMEIVTFSNFKDTTTSKYPSDIIEIGKPLENNKISNSNKDNLSTDKLKECNTDIGFAPLVIKRIDLDELKVPLDYMTNKQLDYKNTNAIINSYNKYFDTASIDTRLNTPQKTFDLNGYLTDASSRENVFIYSSNDGYTFGKTTIYHSTSELREAIQLALCKKKLKKIIVLYEPKSPVTPTPTYSNTPINLKSKNLFELRIAILAESYTKMFNKNYVPQNIKFDPINCSFSCDLVPEKSNFTKISLAYGPLNGCISCTNVLTKNPGSKVLFETSDRNLIYKIFAIVE